MCRCEISLQKEPLLTRCLAVVESISTEPIAQGVFDWLMTLYSDVTLAVLRSTAMHCLGAPQSAVRLFLLTKKWCTGFLFRAYPTLMLQPAATSIMDDVFARATDVDEQARLLGIVQDFLTQQADKNTDVPTTSKGACSVLRML